MFEIMLVNRDMLDLLVQKLKEMLDDGLITQEQFDIF